MGLIATRLRYQKKGFRAKLSKGWFVYDDTARSPVAGPFDTKGLATTERDRLKAGRHVQEKTSRTEETTERSTESGDPSDTDSARKTLATEDPNPKDDDEAEGEGKSSEA